MPLWIQESDVQKSLEMGELIEALQGALASLSNGGVVQPVRTAIEYRQGAYFGLMPAYDVTSGLLGAKLLTVIPGNLQKGLSSHQALIALFDPESGVLVAVVDGRFITEARTAAVSAVSARYLARPDASVLAILGSGVQAHSHLEALRLVRSLDEVRVWSPTRSRLESFVAHAGPGVRAAASAEEAVRGADVVVTATNSTTPVIEEGWIASGAHVIAVGACRPNHHELDPALIARSIVVVDSRAAAVVESGDIILSGSQDRIHAELGEIVSGGKPGRTDPREITIFKSLGLGVEDVVSAGLAYRRACAARRGIQVPM
jgi:ornithine cyclodeaminase/alanine dehydrogenase-like protein (mu-crystallin family)